MIISITAPLLPYYIPMFFSFSTRSPPLRFLNECQFSVSYVNPLWQHFRLQSYQENDRRTPNQSYGYRELSFVAPTVALHWLVCISGQPEGFYGLNCNLRLNKKIPVVFFLLKIRYKMIHKNTFIRRIVT